MSDEQKARAERLRQEIERLKGTPVPSGEADPEEDIVMHPDESPKEYIARRSREIERKNKRNKDS